MGNIGLVRSMTLGTLTGLVCLAAFPSFAQAESLLFSDAELYGNKVILLKDTQQAAMARIDMIRHTQQTLDIIYFNVEGENDRLATMGLAALIHTMREREATGQPIRVRLVIDGMAARSSSKRYLYLLRRAGADIYLFHRPSLGALLNIFRHPRKLALYMRRLHSKIMIKDGREIITGGRNIGDIYFGGEAESKHGGYKMEKRDMDVYATGPSARSAQAYFDELIESPHVTQSKFVEDLRKRAKKVKRKQKRAADSPAEEVPSENWMKLRPLEHPEQYALNEREAAVKIKYRKLFDDLELDSILGRGISDGSHGFSVQDWCLRNCPRAVVQCSAGIKRLRGANAQLNNIISNWMVFASAGAPLDREEQGEPIGEDHWRLQARPVEWAQFLADDMGLAGREGGVADRLGAVFSKLKEGDEIWIQSPVLVPTRRAKKLLKRALDRGVSIHLIVNGPGSTPNTWYQAGYLLTVNKSVAMGLDVCEVQNPRSESNRGKITNHAKSFVILRNIDRKLVPSIVFIGSYNFDPRSQKYNGEAGLLIEDQEVAAIHYQQILELDRDSGSPHACEPVYLEDGYPYGKVNGIDGPEERMAQMHPDMRATVERLMMLMRGRIPVGKRNVYIPLFSECLRWFARQQP
jgi:phosphatidylserine/phosphatidylglycerophosphate/cardiolipin synthase-like enzyme